MENLKERKKEKKDKFNTIKNKHVRLYLKNVKLLNLYKNHNMRLL